MYYRYGSVPIVSILVFTDCQLMLQRRMPEHPSAGVAGFGA